jgi:hypothetical protein
VLRENVNSDKVILAVAKAINAKFDRGKWLELALLTNSTDAVQGHRRLLRSLDWGDEDYFGNVIEVVPRILGERSWTPSPLAGSAESRFPDFKTVEEFVGLPGWLRDHEPELYAELYGGQPDGVTVDELQAAAAGLGLADIDEHAARIRRGLHEDPAQAIGSAKELLETVLKAVLGLHGTGPETKVDVPKLLKEASVKLGLDPKGLRGDEPGAEQRRKTLGALGQLVTGIAELRNAGFGTGHGVSQRPELDVATARLAVAAAVAAATFYIEAHAAAEKWR